jgi:Aromatic amino acid lyase
METRFSQHAMSSEMTVQQLQNTQLPHTSIFALSLAYVAARKAFQISNKLKHILAIELMAATQALDFHRPLKASPVTGKVCELIHSQVPMLTEDRFIYPDIMAIKHQIQAGEIIEVVEELIGKTDMHDGRQQREAAQNESRPHFSRIFTLAHYGDHRS